jgi:dipeptidyl aminopeptidase/acylaminoacyl peptidase
MARNLSWVAGFVGGLAVVTTVLILFRMPTVPKMPQAYRRVLDAILKQYPMPVNVSPNGRFVLVKTRGESLFTISITDASTGRIVATSSSPDTQLELTWSPDSRKLAYLASKSGNKEFGLFVWDFAQGTTQSLAVPTIETAGYPLRWCPDCSAIVLLTDDQTTGSLISVNVGVASRVWKLLAYTAIESDFQISPSGRFIAYVPRDIPDSVVIARLGSTATEQASMKVSANGEVRDLGWAPDETKVICSARPLDGEFFRLFEVDRKTKKVTEVRAGPHDLCHPRYLQTSGQIAFEVSENGLSDVAIFDRVTGRERRTRSPGLTRILNVSTDLTSLYVLQSSVGAPPLLASVAVSSGSLSVLPRGRCPLSEQHLTPAMVVTSSADNQRVHFFVWKPGSLHHNLRRAIIIVHGGPRRQASPKWDANVQLAVQAGFTVAIVNYRGSAGYGKTFEADYSLDEKADDILRVSRYLQTNLGIPASGQVLLAESSGCSIGFRAAEISKVGFFGLVFLSPIELPHQPLGGLQSPRFLHVYQGKNDSLRESFTVEGHLERYLPGQVGESKVRVARVLPSEGHTFQRSATWAEIYARIMDVVTSHS